MNDDELRTLAEARAQDQVDELIAAETDATVREMMRVRRAELERRLSDLYLAHAYGHRAATRELTGRTADDQTH